MHSALKPAQALAMPDEMVIQFSSNSSNQSDHSLPDKLAKLEARLTGKTASSAKQQQQLSVWSSASTAAAGSSEASISDSDDEVASHIFVNIKIDLKDFMSILCFRALDSILRLLPSLRTQETSSSEPIPKSARKFNTLTTPPPPLLLR